MDETSSWVKNLTSLDSHERPILMTWAQGQDLRLSGDACQALSRAIKVPIPGYAFVAMDYTLDWLYAAVEMTEKPTLKDEMASPPGPAGRPKQPDDNELRASIEDIDMLVAWEDEEGAHTVLVEAKGFTSWGNAAMESKAARLGAIFSGDRVERFDVHFVLVGPGKPQKLHQKRWPPWMKHKAEPTSHTDISLDGHRAHFVPITDPGPRLAVQRCTAEGVRAQAGGHWQLVERRWGAVTKAAHVEPVLKSVEEELSAPE